MTDAIAHYESEAEAVRDRISATMHTLQDRLSPRTLLDNAVGDLGARGADVAAAAKSAVRAHPVAVAGSLLAVGLGVALRSRLRHARLDDGNSFAAYPDYDDGYGANSVDSRWADDHPAATARRGGLRPAVERSPLAALVAAAAAGGLVGALLPIGARERDLLAELAQALDNAAGR